MNKLFSQNLISENMFGCYYALDDQQSHIVFGGWDESIVATAFTWEYLITPYSKYYYWSVKVTAVNFMGTKVSVSS
jgi:hypothetical protein